MQDGHPEMGEHSNLRFYPFDQFLCIVNREVVNREVRYGIEQDHIDDDVTLIILDQYRRHVSIGDERNGEAGQEKFKTIRFNWMPVPSQG